MNTDATLDISKINQEYSITSNNGAKFVQKEKPKAKHILLIAGAVLVGLYFIYKTSNKLEQTIKKAIPDEKSK